MLQLYEKMKGKAVVQTNVNTNGQALGTRVKQLNNYINSPPTQQVILNFNYDIIYNYDTLWYWIVIMHSIWRTTHNQKHISLFHPLHVVHLAKLNGQNQMSWHWTQIYDYLIHLLVPFYHDPQTGNTGLRGEPWGTDRPSDLLYVYVIYSVHGNDYIVSTPVKPSSNQLKQC